MTWYVRLALIAVLGLVLAGGTYLWRGHLAKVPQMVNAAVTPTAPTGPGPAPAATPAPDPKTEEVTRKLQIARQHLQTDSPDVARSLVENLMKDPTLVRYSENWVKAADVLSQINAEILFSDVPSVHKISYTVQPKDSLWSIARKHNTTMALLLRSNKLAKSTAAVFPGQELKVYQAAWRIQVNKEHRLLGLYDGERLVKLYHVAIGRQDRTPVGSFVVYNKESEPVWNPPGKIIPYGHPENVLGTRWMGLKPTGETDPKLKGYGIHGTWEPDSIGKALSNGCIRMRNEEVEELFDLVSEGCQVVIEE